MIKTNYHGNTSPQPIKSKDSVVVTIDGKFYAMEPRFNKSTYKYISIDEICCHCQSINDVIMNLAFFFLRMRPAAILLDEAAATNPRFPGTDWSGQ